MCGIIAYRGHKSNAARMVLEGLKKLEYRGYDSWGVAARTTDKKGGIEVADIFIHKKTGKIGELNLSELSLPRSSLAMAHSRWATHGGDTQKNAHPHASLEKDIVIIHNGIVENYLELKKELIKNRYEFVSETDTEVAAHVIHAEYAKCGDLEKAVLNALKKFTGRYAFLVMSKKHDMLIAARRGSPLIVGKGENGDYFVASDIPAFRMHTDEVMYLDDEEMVVIDDSGARFMDLKKNKQVEKRIVKITWDTKEAEKGAFSHFMIKEIMDQKETIHRAINQDEKLIKKVAQAIDKAFGTYFVGCGTTGKVCMVGSYLFSRIAHKHINVEFGSEFPNFRHFIRKGSLFVAVSQSGETADTLEAMEVAKEKGAKLMALVNVEGSSMDRLADISIYQKAGPEKAVASTKATTAQMAILTLIAYACAGNIIEGKKLLLETASLINDMLNPRYEDHIRTLAEKIKDVESMYVIGRGMNYPMALEGAIKLQEVSYIHAEGFAGGELKHGPIALITKGTPCIALVANDEMKNEILSNAIEVKARGGFIIGVSPTNEEVFDYWIKVPDVGNASPIVNIIPVQILAYHLALLRKNDPDMPRNLAKSVTVK